ncbi:hypothetical protein CAPTEDRAFT_186424 [Capitella teleta]|uniref:TOG domain-containing protein n=1 Tax=Capitella teleta TaxID=283909 RepID=R7UB73_CAPTE|nr:hypothetical protein CAPTEDRAFT_186424 [Capitella teleta]|eukprot:ELU00497.1 hypothetical protein CAPTEDRAFT_186424 [Capitella teleta]
MGGLLCGDKEPISMAPTTKEAMNRKRQEELSRKREEEAAEQRRKAEAAEKRRLESERKRQEAEQRRQKEAEVRLLKEEEQRQQEEALKQKERERQQDKLKRLTQVDPGIEGTLAISGNSSQPLNNTTQPRNVNSRPTNNIKKRNHPPVPVAIEKPSPGNEENVSEPFKDPNRAFDESMKLISNEQWDVKCNGIENIRRLALHHPEVLTQTPQLHTLNLALTNEVKNLRSQVSRLAIVALGDIYSKLGRAAETDLELTAKGLVGKYAESNSFIHEELDRTFRNMVDHLTPQRCMCALINGGAGHKSGSVRRATSQFLVPIVERMGPGRVLSGIKDVTDKILPTAANFLLDGSPETRYNGQCILSMLINHDDFDRMITKHLPSNTLRNVQDKLDSLKKKGLGDPPNEPGSAKMHRSGRERSNNSIRGNSASSTGSNSVQPVAPHPGITKRPSAMRTDEATMETIGAFCQKMKANNWQERQQGINDMVTLTESRKSAVCNNITKIFDSFIPCLKDSNSKTNLHALQMMIRLTQPLSEHLGSVVNMLVQNLSANLSSKNKDIYETASQALDELMDHIDAQQLIQPMVQQAQSGSARIKPDMVERVAFLTRSLGQNGGRLKTIRMHSLPLIWHLINTVPTSGTVPGQSGSLRVAVSHLSSALHSTLGEELFKASKDQTKVTPRMLQVLQEMIDNPE